MLAGRSGGVTIPEAVAVLESVGGPNSYAMYPTGWAAASNTPFRLYKHDTHLGGVADPLIIHWPQSISEGGQIRRQYAHVCDVLPTLAKCAGIDIPRQRNGVATRTIQGISFDTALFRDDAPESRLEQHFELSGSRAIYTDGWRLVSTGRFDQPSDRWELFDVRVDLNETNDLSPARPELVEQLERRWFAAAERYDVLPIDTRSQRDKSFANFYAGGERSEWSYFPPIDLIQPEAAPVLFGRTHTIEITTEPLSASDQGVLFAYGNMFLGCVAFIRGGQLHYEYRSWPNRVHRISTSVRPGVNSIGVNHQLTARPWAGVTTLLVNGQPAAELGSNQWPFGRTFQGLQIGKNEGVPVSDLYDAPFAFSGVIRRVRISLDNSAYTPADIARANSPPSR
jgi:arylsulfatase